MSQAQSGTSRWHALVQRVPAAAVESAWVSAGSYALYGAMFAATVLVARAFGAAELGRFGMAWALSQLTVQAGVSGFSALHRRDVAYGHRPVSDLVAETLAVRSVLVAALWLLAGVVGGAALAADAVDARLAWAAGAMLVAKGIEALGMALAETMQAAGDNRAFGTLSAVNAAALGGGVALAVTLGVGTRGIYVVVVAAALVYTLACARAYGRQFGRPGVQWPGTALRVLLAESWPLVANAVVFAAQARVAVLVVGALAGAGAAGVYTFAAGVVGGAAVVASAVGTVLFPKLCARFVEAPATLRASMWRLVGRLGMLGVFVALLVASLRAPLVALYGGLPPGAEAALAVLALGLVPVFAGVAPNYLFTAIGAQRDGLSVALVNAIVVVALVVPLTVRWGAVGAAAGVATAQAMALVLAVYWLDRRHLTHLANVGATTVHNQGVAPAE